MILKKNGESNSNCFSLMAVRDFRGQDGLNLVGGHSAFNHAAFQVVVGFSGFDLRPYAGDDCNDRNGKDANDGNRVLIPKDFGKHVNGSLRGHWLVGCRTIHKDAVIYVVVGRAELFHANYSASISA
jgi:hypothetical protein